LEDGDGEDDDVDDEEEEDWWSVAAAVAATSVNLRIKNSRIDAPRIKYLTAIITLWLGYR
jgi:hypothetical protein